MAKSPIPNPLDRRHLVEKELSPEKASEIAEAYLAEGRSVEAVDFFAKARARDQLALLRSQAIETGDVFLLRAVVRAMEEPAARAEWSATAEAAEAAGRVRDAAEARRQLDRKDDG